MALRAWSLPTLRAGSKHASRGQAGGVRPRESIPRSGSNSHTLGTPQQRDPTFGWVSLLACHYPDQAEAPSSVPDGSAQDTWEGWCNRVDTGEATL